MEYTPKNLFNTFSSPFTQYQTITTDTVLTPYAGYYCRVSSAINLTINNSDFKDGDVIGLSIKGMDGVNYPFTITVTDGLFSTGEDVYEVVSNLNVQLVIKKVQGQYRIIVVKGHLFDAPVAYTRVTDLIKEINNNQVRIDQATKTFNSKIKEDQTTLTELTTLSNQTKANIAAMNKHHGFYPYTGNINQLEVWWNGSTRQPLRDASVYLAFHKTHNEVRVTGTITVKLPDPPLYTGRTDQSLSIKVALKDVLKNVVGVTVNSDNQYWHGNGLFNIGRDVDAAYDLPSLPVAVDYSPSDCRLIGNLVEVDPYLGIQTLPNTAYTSVVFRFSVTILGITHL